MNNNDLLLQPAFTLTAGQLVELIVSRIKSDIPVIKTKTETNRVKIMGIRGLANYLKGSTSTAQKLKNDGKVPFYEVGNRVYFYSDEVDNALKK